MDCPAGQYFTTTSGATAKDTSCTPCAGGTYSEGGVITTCPSMVCPVGQYTTTTTGAIAIDENCTACPITT